MSQEYVVLKKFEGNVRRDPFGRFVVDTCPSDEHHLIHSVCEPGDDRARCRNLVEEAFGPFEGMKGRVIVTVKLIEEDEAQSIK